MIHLAIWVIHSTSQPHIMQCCNVAMWCTEVSRSRAKLNNKLGAENHLGLHHRIRCKLSFALPCTNCQLCVSVAQGILQNPPQSTTQQCRLLRATWAFDITLFTCMLHVCCIASWQVCVLHMQLQGARLRVWLCETITIT